MHRKRAEVSLCLSGTAPGLPHHSRTPEIPWGKTDLVFGALLALANVSFPRSLSVWDIPDVQFTPKISQGLKGRKTLSSLALSSQNFSPSSPHHFHGSPMIFKIQFLQFIFFLNFNNCYSGNVVCHNILYLIWR